MESLNASEQIREIAASLRRGETASGCVCPVCRGGRNRDRSLSVTKTETCILYVCHRGRCGAKGKVLLRQLDVAGDADSGAGAATRHRKRQLPETLEPLPERVERYLREKYEIEFGPQDEVKWAPGISQSQHGGGRVILPLRRFDGSVYGSIARAVHPDDQPKSLTYLNDGVDRAGLAWYTGRNLEWDHAVLVVEDQYSAWKASWFVNTVALLGTHLDLARVREIAEFAPCSRPFSVVLALDKDATNKAVGFIKRFSWAADLRLLPLEKDIKDTPVEELAELLEDKLGELEELHGAEATRSVP